MLHSYRPIVSRLMATFPVALACGTVLAQGAAASSNAPGAGWEITARTFPTNIAPEGSGLIKVEVFNVGAADSNGPVTVTDTLPTGVTATDAGEGRFLSEINHSLWDCTGTTVVTCTNNPENMPNISGGAGGSAG